MRRPYLDSPLMTSVSIITPSFNQAAYLNDTLESVLAQEIPGLEYIVIDGGSTDGSVDIIRRHAGRLAYWTSEPDSGQAEAINKGLARATGDVIAWLNSDDIYRPGAVRAALAALDADSSLAFVYANLDSIDAAGRVFNTIRYAPYTLLDLLAFRIIGQPTVFFRRRALLQAGVLDPAYNFLLDHHLWLRLAQHGGLRYIPQTLAAARHHPAAKNTAQAARFGGEVYRILDWAQTQPALATMIERHPRKVWGGAHRLNARYLLDGGAPGPALRAYARAFANDPAYALKHWRRMVYALASAAGLGGMRKATRR
ncbi:MAG: glycosyltransferase [Anaerolineae bacterium]|nr:MAG: glycosyltransferase [Anaerolineae bacterium]